jgi:hypothetical protein
MGVPFQMSAAPVMGSNDAAECAATLPFHPTALLNVHFLYALFCS